jgi:hypothetical protein
VEGRSGQRKKSLPTPLHSFRRVEIVLSGIQHCG